MINIRKIIDQLDAYNTSIAVRNLSIDTIALRSLYEKQKKLKTAIESLQQERNEIAKRLSRPKDVRDMQSLQKRGKEIKQKLSLQEKEHEKVSTSLTELAEKVPNLLHPECPIGKEEQDNRVIKVSGDVPVFSFKARDHIELGHSLDIIDFETASKVAGTKFYYLKNQAVLLELALLRFGIDILLEHGFSLYQTPDIAKLSIIGQLGFQPRGNESNIYTLEDEELGLIGTAEIPLGAYYGNSILKQSTLPIKLAGVSHCFRREAGAAGQYSKGLYRVHQFTKLEMFIICSPEESEQKHQQLLSIEEEIYTKLNIPYRVVDVCSGDLGNPAYRKFDIEAWMPGRGEQGGYGEITSASNCTDYQAQRLNIRVEEDETKKKYPPHLLNGTAIAISRTLIALLENHQQEDGSVHIPPSLQAYCGFSSLQNGFHS